MVKVMYSLSDLLFKKSVKCEVEPMTSRAMNGTNWTTYLMHFVFCNASHNVRAIFTMHETPTRVPKKQSDIGNWQLASNTYRHPALNIANKTTTTFQKQGSPAWPTNHRVSTANDMNKGLTVFCNMAVPIQMQKPKPKPKPNPMQMPMPIPVLTLTYQTTCCTVSEAADRPAWYRRQGPTFLCT